MASTQDDPERSAVPARTDRCVEIELEDGGVVLYDADVHTAWIQSDAAIPLAEAV